jgi:hypothetical protein
LTVGFSKIFAGRLGIGRDAQRLNVDELAAQNKCASTG